MSESSLPGERLQKVLAQAGAGSRREVERWIAEGRISVNGERAKLADRVLPSDRNQHDGKKVYLPESPEQALSTSSADRVLSIPALFL